MASKPTGPRGRFFLSVFRDAWSVVIRPWSVVEAVEGPFSCTSHAGTRASVQSGRDPWAFGRAFRIAAPFGSSRQPKVWSLPKQLPAGRSLVRRCLVQVAPVFCTWPAGRGALAVVRWPPAVARGLVAPVFVSRQTNKARRPRAVACG